MAKSESELPDDISRRLESAIARVMTEATDKLRAEVGRMFRFANMDEPDAARIVIEENGGVPMKMEDIVEKLKAGGIWGSATGSQGSSADGEIKRSLGRAAAHGLKGNSDITWIDQDKEVIGLTPADRRKEE